MGGNRIFDGLFGAKRLGAMGFGIGKPGHYKPRIQSFRGVPQVGKWDIGAAIESGFYASTWVYRCVMTKCEGGSQAPFGLQRRTGEGKWTFDWRDPISEVLGFWNDDYGPSESISQLLSFLSLGGNALTGMFWSRDRRRDPGMRDFRDLRELRPETPVGVEYVVDDVGSLVCYVARDAEGGSKTWEATDIAHARLVDPANPYWGMGRLQALARAVDVDTRGHDMIRARLEYGGTPDGILVDSTITTGDQKKSAQEEIDRDWRRARGPFVTGGHVMGDHPDIAWIPLGLSQKDLQSLEQLQFSMREICIGFGFNPALWGEDATYNNGETAERQKWTGAIIPDLEILAKSLTRRIIPRHLRQTMRIWFDTSGVAALRDNLDSKIKSYAELVANGVPPDDAAQIVDLEIKALPNGLGKVSYMRSTNRKLDSIANPAPPPALAGKTATVGKSTIASEDPRP